MSGRGFWTYRLGTCYLGLGLRADFVLEGDLHEMGDAFAHDRVAVY